MEVSTIGECSLLAELSPTEKKILDDIAFQKGDKAEKVFASLSFGAIMQESAQIKLEKKIAEHEEYWKRD